MKLVNFLTGMVGFSVVVTLMFLFAANLSSTYSAKDTAKYESLAGGSYSVINDINPGNSSAVGGQLEKSIGGAVFSALGIGDISTNLVSGVKLFGNSITVSDRIMEQTQNDIPFIHPIFITGIKVVISITIIIIVIQMLWRFKADTD